MKTSLDLPDDLYRRVKSKSALEGRAVREVATALFAAWVDGRVPAAVYEVSQARSADAAEPDPRQEWLARWRKLGTSFAQTAAGAEGLVDQLRHDRG